MNALKIDVNVVMKYLLGIIKLVTVDSLHLYACMYVCSYVCTYNDVGILLLQLAG